ncbi:glycosyltransferase family 4 protein [Ruoffia sp. FAM 24228]|uniref:glycosyltransferase family 4 protein n=1 Tax=Ruoffia sp. FAM 24228 TaxID=3259517 RepID=UPI003885B61B
MSKHILIYSQYFYPEQFRINDICLELVKRGYKVSVVTGIPNYPEGKFYEGYSWTEKRTENWQGIDIYRMPIVARGKNKIGLILNYTSFVAATRFLEKTLPQDIDIVFTYEVSPMTQALPAIWYAKRHKLKHVLYVMDLWPENIVAVTKLNNKLVLNQIDKMVDYIYNQSNFILASSKSFVKAIESRGVEKEKLSYWPQYAEDIYGVKEKNNDVASVQQTDELSFVFAGNIGQAQGLSILPKVAKKLKTENKSVKFIIIGDGRYKSELQKQIKKEQVESYFLFVGRQPAYQIPYYLANFDIGLITLDSSDIFEKTIPAKVQSLMACGMPLLVSADGEVQGIVKSAECGFASNSGNVDGFVKNIKRFMSLNSDELLKMKKKSLDYYNENFNKKLLMDQFESIINEG